MNIIGFFNSLWVCLWAERNLQMDKAHMDPKKKNKTKVMRPVQKLFEKTIHAAINVQTNLIYKNDICNKNSVVFIIRHIIHFVFFLQILVYSYFLKY